MGLIPMGRSGQATEWTSQQILDKVLEEAPPEFQDVMKEILIELKKINIQLATITGDEL